MTKTTQNNISYSELKIFTECPHKWNLQYEMDLKALPATSTQHLEPPFTRSVNSLLSATYLMRTLLTTLI